MDINMKESASDMGTIKTTYELDKGLTVITATGRMTAQDFDEWRQNYYSDKVTANILWNIVDADLSEIESEDVATHAQRISADANVRKGGRSAIVVGGNTLALGLSRMRGIYGELADSPIAVEIFTNMDEAREWLGVKE